MEIQLRVINAPSEFRAAPLRDRASVSTKAAFTTHYAAVSGEQEVAFVALDLPDHKRYFCVYELLVDPSHRCRGYGAAVIRKCREFATREGFEKICLKPWPIEAGGSEEKLRAWYTKLDFVQSPEQSDLMEIVFTASPDEKIA
ncbi:GNAT family N-acetyltransferase [Dechloromonas sp. A34]|uniref:GNAT family N-acetyltransferase n=1 Tax=Dechloromonas sp. A34 TaxID=447588 RepID=UPI00224910ED|nr:GNAT family N-acetyltransferase [Dechloromonas sp. A34]